MKVDLAGEDASDARELLSEAGEVEALEKSLDQSLGSLASDLRQRADELEARDSDQLPSDPEEHRFKPESIEELDIDGLFEGLMDR